MSADGVKVREPRFVLLPAVLLLKILIIVVIYLFYLSPRVISYAVALYQRHTHAIANEVRCDYVAIAMRLQLHCVAIALELRLRCALR
jgi:hypothetical protein